MQNMFLSLLLMVIVSLSPIFSQDVTTVEAKSKDISDNLDLKAVASVFGESKDLEDFEKRLNDPGTQISNLDLNGDGEVDYLRVMETVEGETHLIAIQAVIGEDQYQDVATIEVEKNTKGETRVQVVGYVYMYGQSYIYEPVYVRPPVFFVSFWRPYYSPWYSPWYWKHRPRYYHPWRPYPTHTYRTNVNVHINVNNSYNFTHVRRSKTSVEIHNKTRRNDYGKKHPDKSFTKRNNGISNKNRLDRNRKTNKVKESTDIKLKKSSGKKVKEDWKNTSNKKNKSNNINTKKTNRDQLKIKYNKRTNKTNNINGVNNNKKTKNKSKVNGKIKKK